MTNSIFKERKRSGTTMQKKPLHGSLSRNQRKILASQPLPGFPWKGRFQTMQECERYISGDKLECLVCGRVYEVLPPHLRLHDMTAEQYRQTFNIPFKFGLSAKHVRDRLRTSALEQIEKGTLSLQTADYTRTGNSRWTDLSAATSPIRQNVIKKAAWTEDVIRKTLGIE